MALQQLTKDKLVKDRHKMFKLMETETFFFFFNSFVLLARTMSDLPAVDVLFIRQDNHD